MAEALVHSPVSGVIPVEFRSGLATSVPLARVAAAGPRVTFELTGPLLDGWSLKLARACAARRISWLSGFARRFDERWVARLEMDVTLCGDAAPDFLALAMQPLETPHLPEPPILEAVLGEPDGALDLEVHAWDSVGLIAAVLDRVQRAGLVPRALVLETEDECAFHQLSLVCPGGETPGGRELRALRRGVGELLEHR